MTRLYIGFLLVVALSALLRDFFRPSYRPELHYMRGPGPRWHAKHGGGRP